MAVIIPVPTKKASGITFAPSGDIAAENVQAAIEELDAEKSGTGHDHDASYDPAGSAAAALAAAQAYVDSITGGLVAIVDTRDSILAQSPGDPITAFATDNGRVYFWDSSSWYESPIGWMVETAVPDMGAEQDSGGSGYGDDYITDKRLSNVLVGSNGRTEEGGVRLSASEIEFYLSSTWKRAVTGFRFREDDYVLEHQPIGLARWYEVATGNSDEPDLNGNPLIRQYIPNIGAYSTPLTIDGGAF